MIAAQTHGLIYRPRGDDVVTDAGFEPCHEEGVGHMQAMQALEVQVTAIDGIVTSGIHRNLVERLSSAD